VSRVTRVDADTISAELSLYERMFLAGLVEQLADILVDGSDPALERLLPNAYPDDAEAAAEFRRFTAAGLTERKIANAHAVLAAVSDDSDGNSGDNDDNGDDPEGFQKPEDRTILLSPGSAQQWLSTLTDLRLTIANRLGIEGDDDEGRMDEAALPLQQSYYWLGELQESLVQALQT
jgi:hypothetical protein